MLRCLASLGPIGVGLVFMVAAVAKLIAPGRFRQHLLRLGAINHSRTMVPVPAALATGEAMAATALIAGLAPPVVVPATVGMLAVLSGVTIWSTSTKRTEDCGCYGGLVEVHPAVSALLNVAYASLVILGWRAGRPLMRQPSRQAAAIGLVGVIAAIVGALGEWRLQKSGKPLVNLNPLRPGQRWRASWIPEQTDALAQGEHVVVFLGENCHACKLWATPLSKLNANPELPPILGVLAIEREAIAGYAREHGITFPVVPMRKSTFAHLIDATPTIAVLKDGVIQTVDEGVLPPALIERVKQGRKPTPPPVLAGMALAGTLYTPTVTAHNHDSAPAAHDHNHHHDHNHDAPVAAHHHA
jgi:hypothetical protein